MNISATRRPIATKYYLTHHWWEETALVSGPDRNGTLVSIATDSSHRVYNGENLVSTLAPLFLIGSSSFFQVKEDNKSIIPQKSFNFGLIQPRTAVLAALECLKTIP